MRASVLFHRRHLALAGTGRSEFGLRRGLTSPLLPKRGGDEPRWFLELRVPPVEHGVGGDCAPGLADRLEPHEGLDWQPIKDLQNKLLQQLEEGGILPPSSSSSMQQETDYVA